MSTATTTLQTQEFSKPLKNVHKDKKIVINDLIQIIEREYKKGNQSISQDQIQFLIDYKNKQKEKASNESPARGEELKVKPQLPPPLYPPLFNKFTVEKPAGKKTKRLLLGPQPITFKRIENFVIAVLENLANILDNLHLFSKMPMFPQRLVRLLKHTNKLWVLILVFLIRKTVSQLLNLIRKENKIKLELNILKSNKNSKLLETEPQSNHINSQTNTNVHNHSGGSILQKYEKILKDLKFDKMMLVIELIGNFLDLTFNLVELYEWPVPNWFMSGLNVASMAMTIYRMNKDDEYVDDSIDDELI